MSRAVRGLFAMLAVTLAGPNAPALAVQSGSSIESGGIGLTRTEWEAAHGAGDLVDIADLVYDELYAYEDGTFYVAFADSKPGGEMDAAVLFVEIAWEDAVTFEEARAAALALLPADAALAGPPYHGPPTPGGPIALRISHYVSAALDAVPYGPPEVSVNADILVTYHEHPVAINTRHQRLIETSMSRVSLMTSIPEG